MKLVGCDDYEEQPGGRLHRLLVAVGDLVAGGLNAAYGGFIAAVIPGEGPVTTSVTEGQSHARRT